MRTLDEIREAIRQLPVDQLSQVAACLRELDGFPASESSVKGAAPARTAVGPSCMTFDEFVEFEHKSPLRHEFIHGVIFAMGDSSLNHSRIRQNLTLAIHAHLKRSPCEVFFLGLKLVIQREANTIAYCPDVIVDCSPDTRDTYYVRDPKLIAEVLSPSTELIDRREKLQNYRLSDRVSRGVRHHFPGRVPSAAWSSIREQSAGNRASMSAWIRPWSCARSTSPSR